MTRHSSTPTSRAARPAPPGESPAGPPPEASHPELPPETGRTLVLRAAEACRYSYDTAERHDMLAGRWQFIDSWSRLAVALAASLSAVSLFADNAVLTAVLATLTAAASALNAAWDPAQLSNRHRRAAHAYRRLSRQFLFLRQDAEDDVDLFVATRGLDDLPRDVLDHLATTLLGLERDLEAAEEGAPPLNRLRRGYTDPGADFPTTRWGLHRLRRRIRVDEDVARLHRRHEQWQQKFASGADDPDDSTVARDQHAH